MFMFPIISIKEEYIREEFMMFAKCQGNREQERILRQVKEMFSDIPYWRLREVCKSNNWNLESSIDHLMTAATNTPHDYYDENQLQGDNKSNKKDTRRGNSISKDEERVGALIKKGYRVLIILRGPPGVGKSYLARSMVTNFVDLHDTGYNAKDFICSSDDYFYNSKGVYRYNPAYISDAHEFNHRRVEEKTKAGLSPIVVDNTNMQLWEILPYVKYAVQNNYLIEIMEPKTSWRNSTSMLAQKNKHGVPQNRIQFMINKYEKGSVADLTKMLKNTRYTMTLPQMRTIPPIKSDLEKILSEEVVHAASTGTGTATTHKELNVCDSYNTNERKEPHNKLISNILPPKANDTEQTSVSSTRDVYSLLEQKSSTNAWKPYESESADFWGLNQRQPSTEQHSCTAVSDDTIKRAFGEKSLLDLLREDATTSKTSNQSEIKCRDDETKRLAAFQRHTIDCPHENNSFVTLRQIYPNKQMSGLWDLFLKCNGDVDWAVDILLKEDELALIRHDDNDNNDYLIEDDDVFECACNKSNESSCRQNAFKGNVKSDDFSDNINFLGNNLTILNVGDGKAPQRQRSRFSRLNQPVNPALLEVKGNIENCFVLGDDQYSKHMLKIRNFRSGINTDTSPISPNATNTESFDNAESQTENQSFKNDQDGDDDDDDDENDNEDNILNEDMLEMSLGEQLVKQLKETFANESLLEQPFSSTPPLNLKVFIPRSLAKQLYMLWVESAYNHMEEERQKLVREDEDFARLLKNPKYSEFKQSPSNLREILDMEFAWNIYNQDKKEQQQQQVDIKKWQEPTDLASHLTQMKLCETFPDIPRETLLEVLTANDNNFSETVFVLRNTMQIDVSDGQGTTTTQEHLMECARREQKLLNQQVQNQAEQQYDTVSNDWDESDVMMKSPEDAKRLALREFEETRNLSAHHCQLKAECYQKAKEAIQRGNGGAAIYYSQIANLHKKKIDMYNQRAANCIMDVHKYTQNNPDLLDLHYLHLIEALGCLDLFLDRHITKLRLASRNYKHIFIITGRGKHSTGGVSTIKNKVKARLKERCLRWSEVNPGLLKVKIFSGSRHSKNI